MWYSSYVFNKFKVNTVAGPLRLIRISSTFCKILNLGFTYAPKNSTVTCARGRTLMSSELEKNEHHQSPSSSLEYYEYSTFTCHNTFALLKHRVWTRSVQDYELQRISPTRVRTRDGASEGGSTSHSSYNIIVSLLPLPFFIIR